VKDNDAVNGHKISRSSVMKYRKPTVEEFAAKEDENNDSIKESLEEALKESQRIQDELKKLREKLLQENQVEWQNKKEIEKLMERQKQLQEKMQNSNELLDQNLQNQEEFSKPSEELLEKQQKLQELFDKLKSYKKPLIFMEVNADSKGKIVYPEKQAAFISEIGAWAWQNKDYVKGFFVLSLFDGVNNAREDAEYFGIVEAKKNPSGTYVPGKPRESFYAYQELIKKYAGQ